MNCCCRYTGHIRSTSPEEFPIQAEAEARLSLSARIEKIYTDCREIAPYTDKFAPKLSGMSTAALEQALQQALEDKQNTILLLYNDLYPVAWPNLRSLSAEKIQYKLQRNLIKALQEHQSKTTTNLLLPSPLEQTKTYPCSVVFAPSYTHQGARCHMEDQHLVLTTTTPAGTLLGVLDGHGGPRAAAHAKRYIKKNFPSILSKNSTNLHRAMEELFQKAEKYLSQEDDGCTAVLAFIEHATGIITVATAGDSEAFIVRQQESTWKVAPLSCVRNFSHPSDYLRTTAAINPSLLNAWDQIPTTSKIRFPVPAWRCNVSRGFGNRIARYFAQHNSPPAFIAKPKITATRLQKNDIVLLACDGLIEQVDFAEWDFFFRTFPFPFCIQKLGITAASAPDSDNITIISCQITAPTPTSPDD